MKPEREATRLGRLPSPAAVIMCGQPLGRGIIPEIVGRVNSKGGKFWQASLEDTAASGEVIYTNDGHVEFESFSEKGKTPMEAVLKLQAKCQQVLEDYRREAARRSFGDGI